MAFVNLSLLLGTALVGVPIVLHLVMRQQPKRLIFPAIQFIRQRQESNRRTLRVRHFLLLLLRCLLIALAALALARPSVASSVFGNWLVIAALALMLLLLGTLVAAAAFARRGAALTGALVAMALVVLASLLTMVVTTLGQGEYAPILNREAPVAAVMVLDSSPRMQYRHQNRTRLEEAQETTDWLIRQLPPDSRVGVLDSRAITPVFSIDMAAARKMVQRVQTTGVPRSMDQLLETALELVAQSDLPRKEIYILTDLAAAAWQIEAPDRVRRRLDEAKDVALYLIDVGVEDPQDFALGELELSGQTLPENERLVVRTELSCTGSGGPRTVELYVEELDPTLPLMRDGKIVLPPARLRVRQDVRLAAGAAQALEFRVSGLKSGTRQAFLKIVGQDALSIDDIRHFTVVVRDPWLVLVVAPEEVNTSAFVEAISPYEQRMEQRARYECVVIEPDEIAKHSLAEFAAVVMLDPPPLSSADWEMLGSYVRDGGQLALFLGHHARSNEAFNAAEAGDLLPGKLGRQYRVTGRGVYLAPHNYDHPILVPFRPIASSVPWDRFPVFRHWSLRDMPSDSQVLLRFGNQQPALVERRVEQGTVLLMTTPITELDRPRGRQAWNELAGPDDWPRFVLVNQIMRYLTQHEGDRFNYRTGQRVVLTSSPDRDPSRYLLFPPAGEAQPVQARDGKLVIKTTETPGAYRLKGERDGPVARGFSVTLPAAASRLDRIAPEQLDQLLGENRYQLARQRDQIERVQGRQRTGREFYPLLVALLAATLIAEHLLANRFYTHTDPAES